MTYTIILYAIGIVPTAIYLLWRLSKDKNSLDIIDILEIAYLSSVWPITLICHLLMKIFENVEVNVHNPFSKGRSK